MDGRLFLCFYVFYKAGKFSVFDRRAELVVKQLTQLTNYAIKFKGCEQWLERCVYLDFLTP